MSEVRNAVGADRVDRCGEFRTPLGKGGKCETAAERNGESPLCEAAAANEQFAPLRRLEKRRGAVQANYALRLCRSARDGLGRRSWRSCPTTCPQPNSHRRQSS